MKINGSFVYYITIVIIAMSCRQNFEPPVIKSRLAALVVDGYINSGPDSTFIRLSRTKSLDEDKKFYKERGAHLSLEDDAGTVLYNFQELADTGVYAMPGMVLEGNKKYRLRIITTNGNEYLSDEMPMIKTPPIDSIGWLKDARGLVVYANTHDPQNNTHYYRWDYSETWHYRSTYPPTLIYDNGLRDRKPEEYVYECWRTNLSTELLQSTSVKLSQDIIYQKPIRIIPIDGIELSIKYFIFLKQYAITKEYYEYLENLKKVTEQTGSIFEAQPSEIKGNIHAINNADEMVIGYITASTVESKKVYITNDEVQPWNYTERCALIKVPLDEVDNTFRGGGLIPLYYDGPPDNTRVVMATEPICADCTVKGGVTQKPDFWQ